MNLLNFMKKTNTLIKKLILQINKIIDIGIKESELIFNNKINKDKDKKKILKKEFIKTIQELFKYTKTINLKKIELISNYNTLSTILDRLSVEKTKLHHFKFNMKLILTKDQINRKCKTQEKLIKNINLILEDKIEEALQNEIKIYKEERTFT